MHQLLLEVLPWLPAMIVLIACSAFFSASEAAFFYLPPGEQRRLRSGTRSQRIAARLLNDPDRLLSAVLFWNLVVNMAYFAIASEAGLRLEQHPQYGTSAAALFTVMALLTIIFLSEMLPKSLAVLRAASLATWFAPLLTLAVRVVDPVMPLLRLVQLVSMRLFSPGFQAEAHWEIADLERAVELSEEDVALEQQTLGNIVQLSDIRAEEWMRPRTLFRSFPPPVNLADLGGQMTPSGYVLITETDSEEISSAICLKRLSDVPQHHLEHYARSVVFAPWCASVAETLEQLLKRDREVAAVVNEFGETIGILTIDDILDTIFSDHPGRGGRLLSQQAIRQVGLNRWHVLGMTSVRRLAKHFGSQVPPSKNVTVAGVIQESLLRLPGKGDQCLWGPFQLKVVDIPDRGHVVVEVELRDEGQGANT